MSTPDDLLARERQLRDERLQLLASMDAEIARLQEARDRLAAELGDVPASSRGSRGVPIEERARQAVAIVREQPGIRVGEIGKRLGVSRNYAAKVLQHAADNGGLVKAAGGTAYPTSD